MINDFRLSRFDGKPVEVSFYKAYLEKIQKILEVFEDDFNEANGHIDALIKDDLGTISLVIECQDSELKEEMYLALKPYHPY
ncbi:MAG TPA: hypothetical protein PLC18_05320 [Sediminibacterium sp.]|jgi:hypothetical protein|nr:MAG: hypothetical protein B7X68_09320 [Sphingobacteriia bacterium 39-36-14]HQS34811.1 hypothetical protein [Sediminibacterium sp.]